jgi:RecA/RadA recombinase
MTNTNETVKNIEKSKTKSKTKPVEDGLYQTTGSTLANMMISGGKDTGYPFGSVVNVVGKKGSGKTFLAVEGIAASMHKYPGKVKHYYDDTEEGNYFDTESLYGYKLNMHNSGTYEKMSLQLNKEIDDLKKDELLIYVNDSWDGLSTEKEKENLEKAIKNFKKTDSTERDDTFGGAARAMAGSTFFRDNIKKIESSNTLLIIMSQVRLQKAGMVMYESKSGGNALDHYSSTIIKTKETFQIIKEGLHIGSILHLTSPKSRSPRPHRECHIRIFFQYGIDETGSNLIYLYDLLTDEGKMKTKRDGDAAFISKKDWIENAEGYFTLEEACKYIEDNNLEMELKIKVMRKWNDREERAEAEIVARKRKYAI